MSTTSIPSIRTFQMDASTVGVLKSSVNLFRGDVNYTQNLFSMPGRTGNDGLQIDISIQYQSNIHKQAMTWNRTQPTGVLGMGWQLPLSAISLDNGGSPTPGASTYRIAMAGVSSELVREPGHAPLFTMDAALAVLLIHGQPVPAQVRAQFVQRGLPLSASAVVMGDATPWVLRDDALEQEFTLQLDSSVLRACDGGESYQLVNYKFWKVIHYPRYERWAVTNESGQLLSFGGGVTQTAQQCNTSTGNSIEWGVRWVDAGGFALWEGNSAATKGQQQYARVWHLTRAYSRFGESIAYAYNEFPRDHDGLLEQVEQRVGTGGKPYTKACHLTSVTDVFGRVARFEYRPKLWSNTTPESPREYADPHKAVPNTTPNGFQDRYETLYLQGIQVKHIDGSALFAVKFIYNPNPSHAGAEAVANVAGTSGDTCKRLLTAVVLSNATGDSTPGYAFDYILEAGQGTNLGAIRSITWPTGGKAAYRYQAVELPICERRRSLSAPAPLPAQSVSRVWFGADYAVVIWNNTSSAQLSMQVMSWNGQWNEWQPNASGPLLLDGGGTSLSTVNVLASEDFVAVSYDTSKNTNLHLFRKDPARPGQWVPARITGGGTGGCNSPTWQWATANGKVSLMAGRRFVLATQMNSSQNKGSYDLFTWDWPSQSWNHVQKATETYAWFACGREFFASVDMSSKVALSYLSPTGEWASGGSTSLGFKLNNLSSLALTAGASMLAVSHLTSGGPSAGQNNYDIHLLRWNGAYQFTPPTKFSFVDRFNTSHPTTWAPEVISNTLVAVAGNLMRFTGSAWVANSHLRPASGAQTSEQRYAYGPDFGTLIQLGNGAPAAQLVSYDANSSGSHWTDTATAIKGLRTPPSNQDTANWAGAGNPDYLSVGTMLFFRGTASHWSASVTQPIADIQSLVNQATGGTNRYQLNAASVINEGPTFLACALYDTERGSSGHATATAALILRNGGIDTPAQLLSGEQMWTARESDIAGQGKTPGGPSAFFTYPDTANNLDSATRIYLHRYARDAIQGPISDWPVSAITIDDGLSESFTTHYVQRTSDAACDASGEVVKYFQSTVYPGGSADDPVNGSVVSCYLNGNVITTGNDYYNMLDGLLHSVTTLDAGGHVLASKQNSWNAYVQCASDPVDPAAPLRQLYGAYVLQTAQTSVSDGVTSSRATGYAPAGMAFTYTGRPSSVTSLVMNGGGRQEKEVKTVVYACEVYDASRVIHDVSSAVVQASSSSGTTITSLVTTLTGWPTVWGSDVLTLAEQADFAWLGGDSHFPFKSYRPGQAPDGWHCNTSIARRDATGAVLEQADGANTACATILGGTLGLPVATFKAARLAECAWNGFQDYESQQGWNHAGTAACTDTAWLGVQSLRLPPSASLGTSVQPAADRTRYLLGVRYRTAAGYRASSAGIAVTAAGRSTKLPFADTASQWHYATAEVTLDAGTASLALAASNDGNGDVLLDGVLLVPFGTDVTVQSWHAHRRLLRASMSASGACHFLLYDNFNQPLGAVGAHGQLQELGLRFLSRQGNAHGVFDNTSPNAQLTLQMSQGGIAETFFDGGQWARRWVPGHASLWSVSNGVLNKPGNSSDTLTWRPEGTNATTAAFFVEMTTEHTLAGAIGLVFGGGQRISWTPGQGWRWTAADGSAVQAPLAAPPQVADQWLLLVGEGSVLFYADGQLIFSDASHAAVTHGCALDTGTNPLRVNQLAVGLAPRLGMSYSDGAARQRQVHQWCAGDSRIMEVVYDALDRQLASTKVAPGSFGSGAALASMQYRASFLDVPKFLAALENTCAMKGDIADYYAGQSHDGVPRSNDQGYPYQGLRYDASAQSRVIERGKAGRTLSIHDVNTTKPAQRQTTRTRYTASDAHDPVPAGHYFATQTTTPSGHTGRQLVDTSRRAVAARQMDPAGNNVGETRASPSYSAGAGSAGITATMLLPNAFLAGPQSNNAAFVRSTVQNTLGQVAAYKDPDSGITEYLFNGKGKPRFVRVPLDAGEAYFQYTRYDDLGRIVEEGILAGEWNAAVLNSKVNDPTYPTTRDGAIVARTYAYDGGGTDPNALDRMTAVTTFNPAPADHPELGDCTVLEQWEYDALGRVTVARITVSGAATLNASATYHYNNLNEIARIDLPEGSPLPSITYTYDDQGQIISIGTPSDGSAIVSYSWNANGQLQTATRGALAESWSYDSPGNILAHQVSVAGSQVFSQSYTYTPDLQVKTRRTAQAFAGDAFTRDVSYSYDGLQRLSSAVVADGQPGHQAVTLYDANGNIWAGTQDGAPFSASCAAGTDQLERAVLPDGRTATFHYRADGRPDQWRGLAMQYDSALGMVSMVGAGDKVVRYARGLSNQRVLRQQGSAVQLCFQGAGHAPLMIWENGQPRVCIWGADGLAAVHDGKLQYPVTDHQHTVWAVTDAAGAMQASFDYLPFGGVLAERGSAASSWLFRYAGKPWDADTGLYDFGARLYDPALLRFVTPDPARQFASPYVFASNNPLNMVDPSGNLAMWAQGIVGLVMVALAIGGIALSVATFGAAAPEVAAGETALAGATVTGESVAGAGAEMGADLTLTEGGATAASEVSTGAGAVPMPPLLSTQSASIGQNALYILQSAGGGSLTGAGLNGLQYQYEGLRGNDFTAKGFFEALGLGALSGFVSGAFGGTADMPAALGLTKGMSILGAVAFRGATQAAAGMVGKDVATLLTDAVTRQKVTASQLLQSSATGFVMGALSGTFTGIKAVNPAKAAVGASERAIVRARNLINTAIDKALSAAKSKDSIGVYVTGGFFLVSSYAIWSVYEETKS